MKVWLLSHLDESPGNELFLEAAANRDHEVQHIDPLVCDLIFTSSEQLKLFVDGKDVSQELPDIIFDRMGASAPFDSLHVLRHFEELGVTVVNRPDALQKSRDKSLTMQIISRKGVPIPETALVGTYSPAAQISAEIPGPPWIVKLPVSTQGEGVLLVHSYTELEETLDRLNEFVLIQRYIKESRATDVRVMVIGGRAVAAIRRQNTEDEFRSNVHQGGKAEPATLTGELQALAESSANALELDVAGVDILESDRGPLVIEVNGSPGMLSHYSGGQNVPDLVVRYLEQVYERSMSVN